MSLNIENIAVVQNQNQEGILGNLFWYSVGKQLIKVDELELKLTQSGLPIDWMPNPIRAVDAFRRATKESETKKATGTAGVFKNYLVREVFSDKDMVQRNIVIETVDQSGKRLDYESEAGIMRLDKKGKNLITISDDDTVLGLMQDVEQKYLLYRDFYSSQHLRVMVNKILQSLAPTPVRPNGGIYFVPDSHSDGLQKLVSFISSLENSEGFKVPVVDTFDNRNMVNKKLHDHMQEILNQCKGSEGLKKGQVKELIESANAVISNYRNYKGIVSSEAESLENQILLIRAEITKMVADL